MLARIEQSSYNEDPLNHFRNKVSVSAPPKNKMIDLQLEPKDRENLERLVLRGIQAFNYEELGAKTLSPQDQKIKDSYLRIYEVIRYQK